MHMHGYHGVPLITCSRMAEGSRWRRRPRPALVLLLAAGVGALAAALFGNGRGVGRFRSEADHARYQRVYARALAQLPKPERVLEVRTSYGVVRAYRFASTGDGEQRPPLVLLPGRASASPVWADNLPTLLTDRPVYTLDLLGEPGMSVQSTPLDNDAAQAAWLHELLLALPEPRLHLVGLSIGGWTAANLVIHDPTKVASLTLVEPVLVFADLPPEAVLRSIPASVPWLPRRFRDNFSSWTAGGATVRHDPIADLIEAGFHCYDLGVPAPTRLDPAAVAGIGVPVLVVLAADSPMHDSAVAAEARRLLPGAVVEVYPNTSHALNGERPTELARDIAVHTRNADDPARWR